MAKTQKKKLSIKKIADKISIKKTNEKKNLKTKIKTILQAKRRGRPKKSSKFDLDAPAVVIPSKPAYPKSELQYFKKIILEKKDEILQQLEMLRDRMVDASDSQYLNENSPYSLHMAEQGTDAMEKEKNYLWAQRETKFLGYLDDALKRIEDGTYGYCIDCGSVISKGRLEAVPHSQHCISCKTKFSK